MSKYKFRKGIDTSQYNMTKMSKITGISRPTLTNIFNGKSYTNKPYAYVITKMLNREKEIEYFFEII